MIYGIYCIRDEVEDIYMDPMLFSNDEVAKRYFVDCLNAPDTKIGKHPEDFSVWYLGKYDMKEGQIEAIVPKLVERGK